MKALDKTTTLRAQTIFAEWLERTGDHRVAADRAGVSERTGRRWRVRYASPAAPVQSREVKTNLAPEATRFIGRKSALTSIRGLFAGGARLVTVLGPGGMGKTRLALRYADLHLYDYSRDARGGAWFCDLTEARTAEDICGAVGHAIGVPLASTGGPRGIDSADHLGHALRSRGLVMLILDNFEQATAHAHGTVGRWLALAPKAHFLVTSREELRLPGEALWHVESLEVPDPGTDDVARVAATEAVELFVDRARLVRPEYQVRDADAETVAELVRQLDGIPLAIELAAARMAVLPPVQLLTRLKHRFDLLAGGARGVVRRQASMRAAIDWSWGLLSQPEQSALAQCAVFHGGFTVDAAESVIQLDGKPQGQHVLDLIQALRQRSLLRMHERAGPCGEMRIGMYESIAAYAAERLRDHGEPDDVAARHARYYLEAAGEWASKVDSHGGVEARARLALELDNLTAVHQWALARAKDPATSWETRTRAGEDALRAALAMIPILSARGPRGADLAPIDAALTCAPQGIEPGLRWRALLARCDVLRVQGRLPEALLDAEKALAGARETGDSTLEAHVLASLGRLHYVGGRLDEAQRVTDQALTIAQAIGDKSLEAKALGNTATVIRYRRRLAEALTYAERALSLHRETGNARLEGEVLCMIATLYQGQQRMDDARDCYERALVLVQQIGDRGLEGSVFGNLGTLFHELGDLEQSRTHVERALVIFRELGVTRLEACALGNLGVIYTEGGRFEEAKGSYRRALELLRIAGDAIMEGAFLAQLGGVLAAMGVLDEAGETLEAAERIYKPFANEALFMSVSVQRGHLELALARKAEGEGDVDSARRYRAAVRERIAHVESHATQVSAPTDDVRITLRILRSALEQDECAPGSVRPNGVTPDAFVVSRDARAFRAPAARVVRLERRRAVRLILLKLIEHRLGAPGDALSPDTLLDSGWPGERVLPEAGASRVYVALATLRKLGLRRLLVSRDGGYLLDPDVPMVVVTNLA
jgi:predicted ATPase